MNAAHSHIGPWSTYDVVAGLRDAAVVVIQSNNNRIIQAAWSRAGPRMSSELPSHQPARSVGSAHTGTAAAPSHRLCSWHARRMYRVIEGSSGT